MIRLLAPAWLFLLMPVWLLCRRRFAGKPVARILRLSAIGLMLLALAGPVLRMPAREGIVMVVADRSASMPEDAARMQQEWLTRLERAMPRRSRLGVIAFAERSAVEQAPQGAGFAGFLSRLDGHASNLDDAIDTALALVPPDAAARLLVLSDGLYTGADPLNAALNAMARGIPIDTRTQSRTAFRDVAILAFDVPAEPRAGERIVLNAWVRASPNSRLPYRLERNGRVIAEGRRTASAGIEHLQFVDVAPESGVLRYVLTVPPEPGDPVPENNTARALARVSEPMRPLLCLTPTPESGLADLLRRGHLPVVVRQPSDFDATLAALSAYSGVLIENVPAGAIGRPALGLLSAWVRELGGGVMMTGGRQTFGAGGYFKSPLDAILPVSMEMRREHRKFSLAVVIIMDRSGSMAMPAGPGRSKMDLANLGCIQVLDLLSDGDSLAVLAVDTAVHTMVPLMPVERARAHRNKILGIRSQGGGIYVYTGLRAAGAMLADSHAGARHIILFADAADAEEPGGYIALLEQFKRAGITCSVVGLGTEWDSDADFLRDIAARGNGEIYFSDNADDIPRIFVQDTMAVTRQAFVEEVTPVNIAPGWNALSPMPLPAPPPPVGGYNLTYLRPEATVAAVTEDEHKAPLLAFWQAGAGRVVAFTGEADGEFAGPFASWPNAGEFYATAARWAGAALEDKTGFAIRSRIEDDALTVVLHIDPERPELTAADTPRLVVLREQPGREPERLDIPFNWVAPYRLTARVPLLGPETLLAAVLAGERSPVILPPVCLPYSPEHRPRDAAEGRNLMRRLAHATGGIERADLTGIWQTLRTERSPRDLSPIIAWLAALVLLIDIFERRTGFVSGWRRPRTTGIPGDAESVIGSYTPSAAGERTPASEPGKTTEEPEPENLLAGMREARRRAGRRFNRPSSG